MHHPSRLSVPRWLLFALGLAWIAVAHALIPTLDFDLTRYTGRWYEIASIPGFLQSRCARDIEVEYTSAENGALAAQTRCLRSDGTPESTESRVRTLDPASPGALKVTSVNFLGVWWYPFGRESIVVAVGPEYKWVALGHPSLRYGRIIAREPALSDDLLKGAAVALGGQQFDLCKFVTTPQTRGRVQPTRVCDIVGVK